MNKKTVNTLKKLINSIRDLRKQTIKSDDLNDEELFFLQEGYREGLCAGAMIIADELDSEYSGSSNPDDTSHFYNEENWWHTHNDEEGDIGSLERLMVDEELEAVFEDELIKMCNGGLDLNTGLGVDH